MEDLSSGGDIAVGTMAARGEVRAGRGVSYTAWTKGALAHGTRRQSVRGPFVHTPLPKQGAMQPLHKVFAAAKRRGQGVIKRVEDVVMPPDPSLSERRPRPFP
jgi:hypothetical protein